MAAVILPGAAGATLWNFDAVLTGSSGFGASSFHDASGSNVMSGTNLDNITGITGVGGTFDDATGRFSGEFVLNNNPATTFTLSNAGLANGDPLLLVFGGGGGFGELDGPSTLDLAITGTTIAGLSATTLGFNAGFVCCGQNDDDPNSFHSDGADGAILTLWGADDYDPATGKYGYDALIGMDLRVQMSPVPLPAAAWMFLTALGGLGLFGWRGRRRLAA